MFYSTFIYMLLLKFSYKQDRVQYFVSLQSIILSNTEHGTNFLLSGGPVVKQMMSLDSFVQMHLLSNQKVLNGVQWEDY